MRRNKTAYVIGNMKSLLETEIKKYEANKYSSDFKEIEAPLWEFAKDFPGYKFTSASYFTPKVNDCLEWHVDCDGEVSMIIAAYPNPTEILVPIQDNIDLNLYNCDNNDSDEVIDFFIKKKLLEPLNLRVGDIAFLSESVIHRSNPKDYFKSHLVVRLWGKKCPKEK